MGEIEQPVAEAIAGYCAAVRAKDVDAFTALFAEDVRVFDMWGSWTHDGIDAWRGMAEAWFGSLGDEQVAVEFQEVDSFVAGDVAVASAILTFRGLSAAGEELRSLDNRLTWALRRTDDGWRIVHEHTSAPLDEEARAIFRRER